MTNFLSAAKQLGHDFDAYAMQMTTNGNNNHNNNKVKILFGQKGEMPREKETGSEMAQFQKLLLSAATIFWLNSGQTLKTFRYLYVIFMLRIFVFFFICI